MQFLIKMQHKKGLKMRKDDFLLSSDYDENDKQYFYVYNWQTLEILRKFDDPDAAEQFFNAIPD